MRKFNLDAVFKIGVLILASYFLFLLNNLVENLNNGRFVPYQGGYEKSTIILDTKTGKLYYNFSGKLEETDYGKILLQNDPAPLKGW